MALAVSAASFIKRMLGIACLIWWNRKAGGPLDPIQCTPKFQDHDRIPQHYCCASSRSEIGGWYEA
jgi:hypothetical protein